MMDIGPREIKHIRETAVRDAQEQINQRHIEYVIEEADTTLLVESFDMDSVVDGLRELSHAGYSVDQTAEDFIPPLLFCHPAYYYNLRDEVEEFALLPPDDPLICYGVECFNDASMPEGTAILLHPNATAPTHPSNYERPWVVRDPSGVVVYQNKFED